LEIPPKSVPRIFLIDAYALIYRSYFAFISKPLTTASGENTSAPFGFTRFLLDIREKFQPDYIAIVFDAGDSFRDQIYPAYKATREKMPDDLGDGIRRIRDIIAAFHDPVVELAGYEADDVIGTLAVKARDAGLEAVIVSGDKDFYQLVGPGIHLMNPGRGGSAGVEAEWVTEAEAPRKFGLPPRQVADYLALVGDSSDNIPGAKGVGPKTAVQLLQQYPSVEDLLANAERVQPARAAKSLQDNAADIRLSKRLVSIITDLNVDLDLESLKVGEPDNARLRDLFVELEFRALAERFASAAQSGGSGSPGAARAGAPVASAPRAQSAKARVVTEIADLERVVARVRKAGRVAVWAEGTTRDPLRGELAGIGLAVSAADLWYLPFGHTHPFELSLVDVQPSGEVRNLPSLGGLHAVLEDPAVAKVGHDLKRAALALSRAGVTLRGLTLDAMLASYVLDPSLRSHDLTSMCMELLSHKPCTYAEVVGTGQSAIPFAEVPIERAAEYVGEAVGLALELADRLDERLGDGPLRRLHDSIEMPLVSVLTRMELVGISIDEDFFRGMRSRLKRELESIQSEIFKLAGGDFNLNSTPQLRQVLFEKLALPVLRKTKTGPSTDAAVLEELAEMGHDVPRLMIEYREMEKLRSTYVDALPQIVNPRTHRLHTSFNQTVAATGRLSSSDPNLQNIPIRTDLGREIRKGFVAAPGKVFLSVDYSQIELRILAHFSGDPAFVTAFRENIDVHEQTAAVIWDVPIEQVTAAMRGQAKTVNFATLYGQGPFSLARQLGISRDDAKKFIDTYFERFQGVRRFLDEQVEMAKREGYVETLMGRRRYVPELQQKNWNIRAFGERVAQNTPIQGTAADLMKKAMIDVQNALDAAGADAAILLQVHDELLLEVAEDELEAVRPLVVEKMEHTVELRVPLVADSGAGANWYETKG
jgi:DNA polymerase-1